MLMKNQNLERKYEIEKQLDTFIPILEELEKLQNLNFEPYKMEQTGKAIKALLNIRGFKNLKSFHKGD